MRVHLPSPLSPAIGLLCLLSVSMLTACVSAPNVDAGVGLLEERIEVGFSPQRANGQAIVIVERAIDAAQSTINVAAYSFTNDDLAKRLIEASHRGVRVQVVADRKDNQNNKHSVVEELKKAGIAVRLNGRYAILHHKFMVIDGRHVQTGSFNYSASAVSRNAENVVFIKDAPRLARHYLAEWQRLWDEAREDESRFSIKSQKDY